MRGGTSRAPKETSPGRTRPARLLGVLMLVAAACGNTGNEQSGPSTTTVSAPTTPIDTAAPDEAAASPDEPSEDVAYDIEALLDQDPLVIFNAYPPKPEEITYALPPGQRDFDDLWQPGAPWQNALEHVDVYRLHAFQMRHFMDDEQVTTLIEFLRERRIPLMFETEPLIPPDPEICAHTESFEAPWDLEMAERLKALGGEIDIIAIEEPYHFAHLLDTPDACGYTVERIVEEVMLHVEDLRELFGDIPVGSIEPIWATPATRPADMEIWLDTFEAVAGEPLAFLHVDPNWYRGDWAEVAVGIEAVADARDVPFGVLYNGGVETDGETWMNFLMANAAELEVQNGATPQHVSIQSWVDWPDHALPEDDLTALTSGLLRYFGQRLELSIDRVDSGVELAVVDAEGVGVPGVELDVSRVASRGVATQIVRGTVSPDTTEALVLVRANAEDATSGDADVVLHQIRFSEGDTSGAAPNLVPNGDFTAGLDDWGVYGTSTSGAQTVAAGTGRGLAVKAAETEDVYVDGTIFSVTPGAAFEFSVTYELTGAADSVVVSVEFVGGSRANIFANDVPSTIGSFVTGTDGRVLLTFDLIGAGPASLIASSDGDLEHWPVGGSFTVE